MDIILIMLAGICIIVGFAGSILPILPGIPLSYIGILLLHFTSKIHFSTSFLLIWLGIVLFVQILDYFIPIWGTKKFGGSRQGVWGSMIGMIVGMFFAPWGIIAGPFVGAIVGELMAGKETSEALRAGFGSFVGLLFGMIAKLIVAGFFVFYYIQALIGLIQ